MRKLQLIAVLFAFICVTNVTFANNSDEESANEQQQWDTNQQVIDSFFWKRELAHEFQKLEEDAENSYLFARSLFAKRKHDAEEIKEIDAKVESRRRKAYQNYEDSCKINGKFLVRTCPKLEECYAKNKLKFVPLKNNTLAQSKLAQMLTTTTTTTTTTKPTTTKPKRIGRELLERAIALSFFRNQNEDDEESDDLALDDDDTNELEQIAKRFLLSKDKNKNKEKTPPINAELVEETSERKSKAFKKYEEYCEKRKFRIGAQRNCPALNKDLC